MVVDHQNKDVYNSDRVRVLYQRFYKMVIGIKISEEIVFLNRCNKYYFLIFNTK